MTSFAEREAEIREWVTSGPGRHPWREGTAAAMLRHTLAALDEARRERDALRAAARRVTVATGDDLEAAWADLRVLLETGS